MAKAMAVEHGGHGQGRCGMWNVRSCAWRVAAVLALSIGLSSCGCRHDPSPKKKSRCYTHLKLIYNALYEISHFGHYGAENLGKLFPNPLEDRMALRCPASSDDPTSYVENTELKPKHCSYLYNNLGAFTDLDDSLRTQLIIVYEKAEFHGPGRQVAFADGRIVYLERAEFNKALAFTENWMKENGKV